MTVFDLEDFVANCRAASAEPEPWLMVRELLDEALQDRSAVAAALPVSKAELAPIYTGEDVTVVKVVWAPSMVFPPHDHLTWACNGVYAGAERNTLYRYANGELAESGGFELIEGDIGILDRDAIHGVTNPRTLQLSAAIHVYGGDFVNLPRSNWIGDPPTKVPANIEHTKAAFEAANDTSR